jgi:hypothetical protein
VKILPSSALDRRTVLKSTAWAVPVIASAVAAPARLVSPSDPPGVSARPDWVESTPALTVEPTQPGAALPPGVYSFTATGGVSPSAELFRTDPPMTANVQPAKSGGTTATVTLLEGSAVSLFTAFVVIDGVRDTIDPGATLTVTLPTGGGASVALLAERPSSESPTTEQPTAAVYGPTGAHWPSRTPAPAAAFDWVVDVDPTWTAIAAAITTATTQHSTGKVKIRVKPGALPAGVGAGSTSKPAIEAVGALNRPWRILVTPRDGWGTVTGSGGYSLRAVKGVSFVGFDLIDSTVLVRDSHDVALAWSTFAYLNLTANRDAVTGVEFVECVLPDQLDIDNADRMAFRVANGYSIDGVTMSGCYVAPAYKPAGSTMHCDTLQVSGGAVRNLAFVDSMFFQSSSQVLQFETTAGVAFTKTALLGGRRGSGRYPFGPDRHVNVGQNTVWGKTTTGITFSDSVVLGSINSREVSVASATNTIVSHLPAVAPTQGSYTVDSTYANLETPVPAAWLDQNSPMPDRARLTQVWAGLMS